jgi:hypothetical protein
MAIVTHKLPNVKKNVIKLRKHDSMYNLTTGLSRMNSDNDYHAMDSNGQFNRSIAKFKSTPKICETFQSVYA